jgi:hypothetical protein
MKEIVVMVFGVFRAQDGGVGGEKLASLGEDEQRP